MIQLGKTQKFYKAYVSKSYQKAITRRKVAVQELLPNLPQVHLCHCMHSCTLNKQMASNQYDDAIKTNKK